MSFPEINLMARYFIKTDKVAMKFAWISFPEIVVKIEIPVKYMDEFSRTGRY